jgi:hydroxymethylbilane synthase
MSLIRIGTRGSPLALWQANFIAEQLRAVAKDTTVELVIIQTQGDQIQNKPLAQIGGDGLFTKAIQDAVLAGNADVAVHSLKDLPTVPLPGLTLAAIPPRASTRDAFVSSRYKRFDDLPEGAQVATGSMRRKAQILHRRSDLELVDIRGNIETRLRKLDELGLDGLILAEAGLKRLGLAQVVTELLDQDWMLPAVGQGALGLECLTGNQEVRQMLAKLDDPESHQATAAERALLLALGGGCQVPLGAHAVVKDGVLHLRAAILAPDGTKRTAGEVSGPPEQAAELGRRLAKRLGESSRLA